MLRKRQSGFSLVYTVLVMAGLCAILSLAVDFGHVQIAKAELRGATDAAARYGAAGIQSGTSTANAIAAAADNTVDGSPLVLNNADVVVGTWNNGTFTAGGSPANAVQVNSQRSAARGTAVQTVLGRLLGQNSCDVHATAVAAFTAGGYAVVGLNFIQMKGNSSDAYWSSTGIIATDHGSIASNGSITLQGNSYIHGDARPGVGQQVNGTGNVSGSTAPLSSPLVYANGNPGNSATTNDNGQVPNNLMSSTSVKLGKNQNGTIPGGTYYVQDFTTAAGSSLTFTGPATIYVYGNLSISGGAITYNNIPGNLNIIMVPNGGTPPGSIAIGSSSSLYANIYAPQSDATFGGTGDFYGRIIAQSIAMTGTSSIHYDLSLPSISSICLVK